MHNVLRIGTGEFVRDVKHNVLGLALENLSETYCMHNVLRIGTGEFVRDVHAQCPWIGTGEFVSECTISLGLELETLSERYAQCPWDWHWIICRSSMQYVLGIGTGESVIVVCIMSLGLALKNLSE